MVDHYSRPGSVLAAVLFGCTWAGVQLLGAAFAGAFGAFLRIKPALFLLPCALFLVIGSLLLFTGITRWLYVAVVLVESVVMVNFLIMSGSYGWVTVMMIGPVVGVVFALAPATGRWLPRRR